jgi:hypothetical protein
MKNVYYFLSPHLNDFPEITLLHATPKQLSKIKYKEYFTSLHCSTLQNL